VPYAKGLLLNAAFSIRCLQRKIKRRHVRLLEKREAQVPRPSNSFAGLPLRVGVDYRQPQLHGACSPLWLESPYRIIGSRVIGFCVAYFAI